MEIQIQSEGHTTPEYIIEATETRGFSFGTLGDLVDVAKKQKVKGLIGRIKDKNGKRKYISSSQGVLGFDSMFVYYPAAEVKTIKDKRDKNLDWIYKHIIGALNKSPLIPQEVTNNIAQFIKNEFTKLSA